MMKLSLCSAIVSHVASCIGWRAELMKAETSSRLNDGKYNDHVTVGVNTL